MKIPQWWIYKPLCMSVWTVDWSTTSTSLSSWDPSLKIYTWMALFLGFFCIIRGGGRERVWDSLRIHEFHFSLPQNLCLYKAWKLWLRQKEAILPNFESVQVIFQLKRKRNSLKRKGNSLTFYIHPSIRQVLKSTGNIDKSYRNQY